MEQESLSTARGAALPAHARPAQFPLVSAIARRPSQGILTNNVTSRRYDAPIVAAIAALVGDDVLGFVTRQRWFAGKGAAPGAARVASVIVLPWGAGRFAVTRVVVTADNVDATY